MKQFLKKEIHRLERKEERERLEQLREEKSSALAGIEEKIPSAVRDNLRKAFFQAFRLIFAKGDFLIGKTINWEKIEKEFSQGEETLQKRPTRRSLNKLEQKIGSRGNFAAAMTGAEGVLLGLVGVGLPDIPLFLAVLFRGIYETAAGYGFSVNQTAEKVYALRLICGAMAKGKDKQIKQEEIEALEQEIAAGRVFSAEEIDVEIRKASDFLAERMIVGKFLQGMFVIGVVGGIENVRIYRRVTGYAKDHYKKRYLKKKLNV